MSAQDVNANASGEAAVATAVAPDLTLKESDAPLPVSLDGGDETSTGDADAHTTPEDAAAAADIVDPRGGGAKSDSRGGGRGGGPGQYLNRERFKTGGPQRTPLTEDELTAKLERARQQNAAIIARREQVEADKNQYEQLTAQEREERAAHARKKLAEKKAQIEQEEERAKIRARKLEKQDTRSWDSEKQDEQLWQSNYRQYAPDARGESGAAPSRGGGGARGSGRGGGRGSGNRGGNAGSGPSRDAKKQGQVDVNDAAEFPALAGGGSSRKTTKEEG
ncbi:unnamed protein product [Tilletia controversa]|uniref:Uncharacterized protein n=3 Tax=Tilletia TaxID=13289 RepID=A0A8X7SXM6_9BASI|nr:hypothetical protein CF336_g3574 [Tilletia laevis]KAE8194485.1 hypothetical protein CF328_g4730 [Tilletia controversa]KAE8258305.1 hypothetical protein A4X03_0g4422 [Tilletia caries]KAE8198520.1 hypothetical protein CF335_g4366 [Tilletia laevis]KAE8248003.1 hypothetical protein A4X06_0g4031 [Tilletia controversa]